MVNNEEILNFYDFKNVDGLKDILKVKTEDEITEYIHNYYLGKKSSTGEKYENEINNDLLINIVKNELKIFNEKISLGNSYFKEFCTFLIANNDIELFLEHINNKNKFFINSFLENMKIEIYFSLRNNNILYTKNYLENFELIIKNIENNVTAKKDFDKIVQFKNYINYNKAIKLLYTNEKVDENLIKSVFDSEIKTTIEPKLKQIFTSFFNVPEIDISKYFLLKSVRFNLEEKIFKNKDNELVTYNELIEELEESFFNNVKIDINNFYVHNYYQIMMNLENEDYVYKINNLLSEDNKKVFFSYLLKNNNTFKIPFELKSEDLNFISDVFSEPGISDEYFYHFDSMNTFFSNFHIDDKNNDLIKDIYFETNLKLLKKINNKSVSDKTKENYFTKLFENNIRDNKKLDIEDKRFNDIINEIFKKENYKLIDESCSHNELSLNFCNDENIKPIFEYYYSKKELGYSAADVVKKYLKRYNNLELKNKFLNKFKDLKKTDIYSVTELLETTEDKDLNKVFKTISYNSFISFKEYVDLYIKIGNNLELEDNLSSFVYYYNNKEKNSINLNKISDFNYLFENNNLEKIYAILDREKYGTIRKKVFLEDIKKSFINLIQINLIKLNNVFLRLDELLNPEEIEIIENIKKLYLSFKEDNKDIFIESLKDVRYETISYGRHGKSHIVEKPFKLDYEKKLELLTFFIENFNFNEYNKNKDVIYDIYQILNSSYKSLSNNNVIFNDDKVKTNFTNAIEKLFLKLNNEDKILFINDIETNHDNFYIYHCLYDNKNTCEELKKSLSERRSLNRVFENYFEKLHEKKEIKDDLKLNNKDVYDWYFNDFVINRIDKERGLNDNELTLFFKYYYKDFTLKDNHSYYEFEKISDFMKYALNFSDEISNYNDLNDIFKDKVKNVYLEILKKYDGYKINTDINSISNFLSLEEFYNLINNERFLNQNKKELLTSYTNKLLLKEEDNDKKEKIISTYKNLYFTLPYDHTFPIKNLELNRESYNSIAIEEIFVGKTDDPRTVFPKKDNLNIKLLKENKINYARDVYKYNSFFQLINLENTDLEKYTSIFKDNLKTLNLYNKNVMINFYSKNENNISVKEMVLLKINNIINGLQNLDKNETITYIGQKWFFENELEFIKNLGIELDLFKNSSEMFSFKTKKDNDIFNNIKSLNDNVLNNITNKTLITDETLYIENFNVDNLLEVLKNIVVLINDYNKNLKFYERLYEENELKTSRENFIVKFEIENMLSINNLNEELNELNNIVTKKEEFTSILETIEKFENEEDLNEQEFEKFIDIINFENNLNDFKKLDLNLQERILKNLYEKGGKRKNLSNILFKKSDQNNLILKKFEFDEDLVRNILINFSSMSDDYYGTKLFNFIKNAIDNNYLIDLLSKKENLSDEKIRRNIRTLIDDYYFNNIKTLFNEEKIEEFLKDDTDFDKFYKILKSFKGILKFNEENYSKIDIFDKNYWKTFLINYKKLLDKYNINNKENVEYVFSMCVENYIKELLKNSSINELNLFNKTYQIDLKNNSLVNEKYQKVLSNAIYNITDALFELNKENKDFEKITGKVFYTIQNENRMESKQFIDNIDTKLNLNFKNKFDFMEDEMFKVLSDDLENNSILSLTNNYTLDEEKLEPGVFRRLVASKKTDEFNIFIKDFFKGKEYENMENFKKEYEKEFNEYEILKSKVYNLYNNFNFTNSEKKKENIKNEIKDEKNIIETNNKIVEMEKKLFLMEKRTFKDFTIKTNIIYNSLVNYVMSNINEFQERKLKQEHNDFVFSLDNLKNDIFNKQVEIFNTPKEKLTFDDYKYLSDISNDNKFITTMFLKQDFNNDVIIGNLNTYEKIVNFDIKKYFKAKTYMLNNLNIDLTNEEEHQVLDELLMFADCNISDIQKIIKVIKDVNFNSLHMLNFEIIKKSSFEDFINSFDKFNSVLNETDYEGKFNTINLLYDNLTELKKELQIDLNNLSKKEVVQCIDYILYKDSALEDKEMYNDVGFYSQNSSSISNHYSSKPLFSSLAIDALIDISNNLSEIEITEEQSFKNNILMLKKLYKDKDGNWCLGEVIPVIDKRIYGQGYATSSCLKPDGVAKAILMEMSKKPEKWCSLFINKIFPLREKEKDLNLKMKEFGKKIDEYNKQLLKNNNVIDRDLWKKYKEIKNITKEYFYISGAGATWLIDNQLTIDNMETNRKEFVLDKNGKEVRINKTEDYIVHFIQESSELIFLNSLKEALLTIKNTKKVEDYYLDNIKNLPFYSTIGEGYSDISLVGINKTKIKTNDIRNNLVVNNSTYTDAKLEQQHLVNICDSYKIGNNDYLIKNYFNKFMNNDKTINDKNIEEEINKINNIIINHINKEVKYDKIISKKNKDEIDR